jgi:hypothetical protein
MLLHGNRIACHFISQEKHAFMAKEKHAVEIVRPTLEIEEELQLHEKGWVIQRIGWFLIIAAMLAGALGVFGEGILSKQRPSAGNIQAEYEHFLRFESETKLAIQSADEHISTISLPQKYLKDFRVIRFVPEPVNSNTTIDDIKYNFPPAENHIVSIYLMPKTTGSINGLMKVNTSNQIPLHHFIYP